ncbi:hypothetical protein PGT21_002712 [Puccinia graminis f. sp. tritici]|uniref:Uncharacterized protein n=1 Tax=Puccinia graminis f. sp. tritici TaxID=56615 RepID=A0A5B0PQX8_PUCGR|nr:hypothetical protein PGT21_002712 [Puccinia graminis f. sp. tritici]
MSEMYGLGDFEAAFNSKKTLRKLFRKFFGGSFGVDFEIMASRNFFESISNNYREVFERFSESPSEHIAKCTWTKVQDVAPCGRVFRNISERASEMFRNAAPVV